MFPANSQPSMLRFSCRECGSPFPVGHDVFHLHQGGYAGREGQPGTAAHRTMVDGWHCWTLWHFFFCCFHAAWTAACLAWWIWWFSVEVGVVLLDFSGSVALRPYTTNRGVLTGDQTICRSWPESRSNLREKREYVFLSSGISADWWLAVCRA